MLNLIGEGLAKGTKKALQETAEEVGEKAAKKVARKTMSSLADDVLDTGPSVLNSLVRQSKGPSLVDIAKARTKVMPEYTTIYHNTPLDNVDSIVKNGIKADAGARKYPDRSEVGIWGSSVKGDGYGGSTIAFRMPADEAKKYMVNDTEYLIPRDIAPEDIVDVDRMLVSSGGATLRQSQIPEKIAKYGEDKVVEVMKRFGADDNTIKAMLGKLAQQDRLSTPYLMSVEPDFTPDYDTRMTIDKLRDSAKRIGSKDVAKVNKKTLPVGWKELEKRMDLNYMDDKIAKLAGKEKFRDVTLSDMNRILDDMGYGVDPELIKRDGIQTATYNALKDALDDEMAIDLQTKGGRAAADFLKARSGAVRGVMSSPEDFYFGNEGRAGYLDAELSDRLGIGRSNTPLSDDLNDYISKDTAGDYFATGIGLKPSELLRGENELSTLAHERLHSFQHTAGEYDPGVKQAYDELHDALAPYKMNEDQMKAYLEGNGKLADADTLGYYVNDREQEARMFQEFLERAGYTKTGKFTAPSRITGGKEFDEGIDTPFNQFLLKLRTLSKAGIALPAVGLALLLGENYNNKKKEG